MRSITVIASILSVGGVLVAVDAPDPLAERKAKSQKSLERHTFQFRQDEASLRFSLSQYTGDCKIHMIFDPKASSRLTFRFEREGKEILRLIGHHDTVFRTDKDVLYYAHFGTSATGCIVASYNLTTGDELWKTKLRGVGAIQHFGYSNKVTIGVSSSTRSDKNGDGTVTITGRESFGDYIEVLDKRTGKLLAHKMYREHFAPIK